MDTAVAQDLQIQGLIDAFERQRIVSDYYTVYNTVDGSAMQTLAANTDMIQLTNSCFTIMGETIDSEDKAAHFEFFLSATFNPGLGTDLEKA